MTSAVPSRVMIAGDWHGNAPWARHVIGMAARVLGEERPLILHLGDFGVWPGQGGRAYLDAVRGACMDHNADVRFIDGNHEDFTQLQALRIRDDIRDGIRDGIRCGIPDGAGQDGPRVQAEESVRWIPRGTRWTWHGRTWLALGGGVSLDRAARAEGRTWWPEEEITEEQAAAVITDGPADVLLSHDCPAGVRHSFPPPPPFWDPRDLARNEAHRERLQRVVTAVRPRWLVHGHLHRAYQRTCDLGYGPVEVTGLDCDGGRGRNYAALDVRLMQWQPS
jgi:hypothetical protein